MVARFLRSMADNARHSGDKLHPLYRELPSVDQLVGSLAGAVIANGGHARAVSAARHEIDRLRRQIAAGKHDSASLAREVRQLRETLSDKIAELDHYSLRPVINATGVILHTNLGRAPLSRRALDHINETAQGYCNLEFDLKSGGRGRREQILEGLFVRLMAAQSGVTYPELSNNYGLFVANNCAGAIFLTLHALAAGGEVIVSRGELIEIGGGFRVPEILERAGAVLREVGTTNKTRLEDYANAITERTKLILRVHRSNFRVTGFTERPDLAKLAQLAHGHNLPVVEDQGTGALLPIRSPGRSRMSGKEPTFAESVIAGVDVIAASGDKLLGGPQAGLIFGRRDLMKSIGRNPLARAFRVDKLTYAALEATLLDYAAGAESEIPVVGMMNLRSDEILRRAEAVAAAVSQPSLTVSIQPGHSVIGGGTTPGTRLRTHLLRIAHCNQNVSTLVKALRDSSPALVARVAKDHVLLDLRTVAPELDPVVAGILNLLPA
jgi:L-seryl-tRNA(Ser) seleniumtransferase